MSATDDFRRLNTRNDSVLPIGGFRPTQESHATHFGKTPLARLDETWPYFDEAPMMAVCQINLAAAPSLPPLLSDLRLLTFFIAPDARLGRENGEGWCLRAYNSLDGLSAMVMPAGAPHLAKGF